MSIGTLILLCAVLMSVNGISRKFHPSEVYDKQNEHEPGGLERPNGNQQNRELNGNSRRPFLPRSQSNKYKISRQHLGLVRKSTVRNENNEKNSWYSKNQNQYNVNNRRYRNNWNRALSPNQQKHNNWNTVALHKNQNSVWNNRNKNSRSPSANNKHQNNVGTGGQEGKEKGEWSKPRVPRPQWFRNKYHRRPMHQNTRPNVRRRHNQQNPYIRNSNNFESYQQRRWNNRQHKMHPNYPNTRYWNSRHNYETFYRAVAPVTIPPDMLDD